MLTRHKLLFPPTAVTGPLTRGRRKNEQIGRARNSQLFQTWDAVFHLELRKRNSTPLRLASLQSAPRLPSLFGGSDVRTCNKAACLFITAAACVRRLPFMLLKSRVVT